MVREARVEYVAGGWPGERYAGVYEVAGNFAEGDENPEVMEGLARKARAEIAKRMAYQSPSEVRIVSITLL